MPSARDKTLAAFGEKQAASYDDRFAKASAMRDAMHLVTRLALGELKDDARVLCVGAGTGLEIGCLAAAFPQWRFMAVEPAPAMLAQCRKRAGAEGFADRCEFHEGFLESLPEGEPYDAATCLLVSHFLERPERSEFFTEIARRLQPGATLVTADLASAVGTPGHARLMAVWRRMWLLCDTPIEQVDQMLTEFEKKVPLLPPADVVELVCAAGFEAPTSILQTLLIHGWSFRRAG
jgi:tRNA (cmo5U34)-methyltransferase